MIRKSAKSLFDLAKLPKSCDYAAVQIFGPYAPCAGRSRWRVQVVDPGTKTKHSVTFPSREAAELFIPQLREELARKSPMSCHEAIRLFIAYKETYCVAVSTRTIGDRLLAFLPDVPLPQITEAKAQQLYLAETQRKGKFGQVKAATHHASLKGAREFFNWLVKKGHAQSNPFVAVESVGRASAGKVQPTETDAHKLDALLFEAARAGEEGALALLVQLYLGLRSSEVLKLQVAAVEREGRKVSIVRGKTRNARRSLDLFPDVARLLGPLCVGRPSTERVFASHLPQCPAPNYLYKRLHQYCRRAGIREYCPHSLRGLHSSLALVGGATSHQVAASLGHSSFATTAKHYADPSAIENSRSKRLVAAMKPDSGDSLEEAVSELTADQKARLLALLTRPG